MEKTMLDIAKMIADFLAREIPEAMLTECSMNNWDSLGHSDIRVVVRIETQKKAS